MYSVRGFLLSLATLLVAFPINGTDPFHVPDFHPEAIVGTWSCRLWNTRHTITFAKDYTFKGICLIGDKITDRYEGEFRLVEQYVGMDELVWKYLKSDTIPVGTIDRDKVEILNDKHLVIWTKKGHHIAYQKVSPATK